MVSKKFKVEVFGRYKDSDLKPIHWDWSNERDGIRKLDIKYTKRKSLKNAYYCYMVVSRNTEEECYDEFDGQVSDGYFENDNIGKIWEVLPR